MVNNHVTGSTGPGYWLGYDWEDEHHGPWMNDTLLKNTNSLIRGRFYADLSGDGRIFFQSYSSGQNGAGTFLRGSMVLLIV